MDVSKGHTGDIYTALRVKRMGHSWSWGGGYISRAYDGVTTGLFLDVDSQKALL